MGEFILPDATNAHTYFEDFDYYTAADWTVTEVGTSAQTLTDADGGRLGIVNAPLLADSAFLQKVGSSFLFQLGKKLWFDCLFEVDDGTETIVIMGLQVQDTTPKDATDGVYFIKADGATSIDLVVVKGGVSTVTSGIANLGNATFIRLSYYYDGKDSIKIYADGKQVASSSTENLPDTVTLTVSFGIENGEASLKTMAVDYVFASKER